MIEDQIIELQTKLAYQEDAIQQLNDVIYHQQQQIDKLEKLSSELQQRIRDLGERQAIRERRQLLNLCEQLAGIGSMQQQQFGILRRRGKLLFSGIQHGTPG